MKKHKEIFQGGSEAPRMAKPKENQSPMEETKPYKLKMAPNFIIESIQVHPCKK